MKQIDFEYFVDQFDDMRVLKYELPGFESLTPAQKLLIYYMGEAALAGRDMVWVQNFRYNLIIRRTFEAILKYSDENKDTSDHKALIIYAKRLFFTNGIHHHYSSDKLKPGFSQDYFSKLLKGIDCDLLPVSKEENIDNFISFLTKLIFDETIYAKKIELRSGADLVLESAVNFYENVTQKEVEEYYKGKADHNTTRPVSLGLNSRVFKNDGIISEDVYHSGGLFGPAIDRIIYFLGMAASVAESKEQSNGIKLLIDFYRTGDLRTWDEYNISWAQTTDTEVDYINGFIETYSDPLGMKATWESVVQYIDIEGTRRTKIITENAQWFEDNSPVQAEYRKEKVTGVAARVINVAMLGGDCYPASPLGINLPNANWIRKEIGSKSVTLANITAAHDITSRGNGFLDEFAADKNEVERILKFGSLSDALHTDLHECVGHASGKLRTGTDPNALKNYSSTLEEARADLFALYFITDKKLIELGLLPSEEAGKASYDAYLRNGFLTQLVRIKPGKDIEEAHMRCRSIISHWVFEKGVPGDVVGLHRNYGKTYVKINDYYELRRLFGTLLREIQRIKSEGDYEAAQRLVETYGVKVNNELHNEILCRYKKLNLAPYTGFVNPRLVPVQDENQQITDVRVEYVNDYLGQMLEYGEKYSFL